MRSRRVWGTSSRSVLFASNWLIKEKTACMAKQPATSEIGRRHYRWKELGLLIVPFLILLLEMFQLPLAQYYKASIDTNSQLIPFSTSILPNVHDLVPILGLIAAIVVVHILLNIFFPKADQMLFPIVALLSGLGVLMALRNGPDASTGSDPNLGSKQDRKSVV